MRTPLSLDVAVAALLALGATGCATADAPMADDDAGEKAPGPAPRDDGADASCCADGAFYQCPSADAATRCAGAPLDLARCMGACTGTDGTCEAACADKYAPDTSSCQRDPSGDGSCEAR